MTYVKLRTKMRHPPQISPSLDKMRFWCTLFLAGEILEPSSPPLHVYVAVRESCKKIGNCTSDVHSCYLIRTTRIKSAPPSSRENPKFKPPQPNIRWMVAPANAGNLRVILVKKQLEQKDPHKRNPCINSLHRIYWNSKTYSFSVFDL